MMSRNRILIIAIASLVGLAGLAWIVLRTPATLSRSQASSGFSRNLGFVKDSSLQYIDSFYSYNSLSLNSGQVSQLSSLSQTPTFSFSSGGSFVSYKTGRRVIIKRTPELSAKVVPVLSSDFDDMTWINDSEFYALVYSPDHLSSKLLEGNAAKGTIRELGNIKDNSLLGGDGDTVIAYTKTSGENLSNSHAISYYPKVQLGSPTKIATDFDKVGYESGMIIAEDSVQQRSSLIYNQAKTDLKQYVKASDFTRAGNSLVYIDIQNRVQKLSITNMKIRTVYKLPTYVTQPGALIINGGQLIISSPDSIYILQGGKYE